VKWHGPSRRRNNYYCSEAARTRNGVERMPSWPESYICNSSSNKQQRRQQQQQQPHENNTIVPTIPTRPPPSPPAYREVCSVLARPTTAIEESVTTNNLSFVPQPIRFAMEHSRGKDRKGRRNILFSSFQNRTTHTHTHTHTHTTNTPIHLLA